MGIARHGFFPFLWVSLQLAGSDGHEMLQMAPGLQDVEKAVVAFESSGKVPTTVMEARLVSLSV